MVRNPHHRALVGAGVTPRLTVSRRAERIARVAGVLFVQAVIAAAGIGWWLGY